MRISLYRAGAGFLAGVLLAVLTGCRAEPAMSGEAEVTPVLIMENLDHDPGHFIAAEGETLYFVPDRQTVDEEGNVTFSSDGVVAWNGSEWQELYHSPEGQWIQTATAAGGTLWAYAYDYAGWSDPVLLRRSPGQEPVELPLDSAIPMDGGAAFSGEELVLWSRSGELEWFDQSGTLRRTAADPEYQFMDLAVETGGERLALFAENGEQAAFRVYDREGTLVQTIGFPADRRIYSYRITETGLWYIAAIDVVEDEDSLTAQKRLVYVPFDRPEEEQLLKLTGDGLLYANNGNLLVRPVGSYQDGDRYFLLEPENFTLNPVDTGSYTGVYRRAQVVTVPDGFYIFADWLDESYDVHRAALRLQNE